MTQDQWLDLIRYVAFCEVWFWFCFAVQGMSSRNK